MNYWKAALTILAALSTSLAVADDFKTINGREYKNATVTRVEADGIVVKSKSGISKVYFVELPKDVQERFYYDPQKAVAARAAEQAADQQANDLNKLEQERQSAQRQVNQAKQRQWAEQQAKQGDIQNLVDRLNGLQKQEENLLIEIGRAEKAQEDARRRWIASGLN
jgi:chromosome segregation ATPase